MKKDVNIRIRGTYIVDDSRSTTELFTVGTLSRRDDRYYINYEESETTGFSGCTTTLRIDGPERVTLSRGGASSAYLILQKGVRNVGSYDMMGQPMEIGIFADRIDGSLSDEGGSLHLHYTLDINSALMSENELDIRVSEA